MRSDFGNKAQVHMSLLPVENGHKDTNMLLDGSRYIPEHVFLYNFVLLFSSISHGLFEV